MSISSVAVSGLEAAQVRLKTAAENIANSQTPDYKAKEVAQSTQPDGSVKTEVVTRDPATVTESDGKGGTQVLPNTSPEEELVNIQIATYTFKANLKILKTVDDLQDSLLDINA